VQQVVLDDHQRTMNGREGVATVAPGAARELTTREFDIRFGQARPRLEALCMSLVGGGDALDVVHDVYLDGRRHLSQLRDPDRLEAWLARIAVNRCYSLHRRSRFVALAPYALAVLEAQGASDLALRELIELLPPRERTVLVLHYGHGYALDEIAAMLELNYATVRSIISRTRQRLYREWSAEP
jgi:RNA polymerase sigma-70 factor, ECF subfamily